MNGRPGWIERLRALQRASFGQNWKSNLQRLNDKLGLPDESRFSLVVPAAPPPLFNGDVQTIKPGHWALVVPLNHQLGSHNVEPSADAQWDSEADDTIAVVLLLAADGLGGWCGGLGPDSWRRRTVSWLGRGRPFAARGPVGTYSEY